MRPRLRLVIRQRAEFRCEYCHLPESAAELRFQVDHVVAEKHGGRDLPANLCWACFHCNSHKGPNLAGIDPVSGELVRLFNPREDKWSQHFRWAGAKLAAKTPEGRVTLAVLCINRPDAILLRRSLLSEGMRF